MYTLHAQNARSIGTACSDTFADTKEEAIEKFLKWHDLTMAECSFTELGDKFGRIVFSESVCL